MLNAGCRISLDGLKNRFDACDHKLIMECINKLCDDVKKKDEFITLLSGKCDDVKKKDEIIMLLSGKCDCKIEYEIEKFKSVSCFALPPSFYQAIA